MGGYTTNIHLCPRCGGSHLDVTVKPLSGRTVSVHRGPDGAVVEYTHFGTCPVLDEPILMRPEKKESE